MMSSRGRLRHALGMSMLGAASVAAGTRSIRRSTGFDEPAAPLTIVPDARLRAAPERPLRIFVLGLRGFPGVEGGVETHAQNLYPRLAALGCDVEVAVRSPYVAKDAPRSWRGVRFRRIWAPKMKGHEAAVHSLLAILVAARLRPDVVHVHAIGSSMWVPLARLLGLKVVVTHHSLNYEHEKWGKLARMSLRFGEFAGMRFSNRRIAIARPIAELMPQRHGVDVRFIPNGVTLPEIDDAADRLAPFGLQPGRYALCVGRLTPEKRQLDLIEAFAAARLPGWKLALVGATEATPVYSRLVLDLAARTPGVVCTGYQAGEDLRQLYQHAGVFVLPSSHEGLSIAMLEALSFGLPVVASDIPGNLAVGLADSSYFPVADVPALAERLRQVAARPTTPADRQARRRFVEEHYDWADAAQDTLVTYREVVTGKTALRLVTGQAAAAGA